jgi:hypothetical protein
VIRFEEDKLAWQHLALLHLAQLSLQLTHTTPLVQFMAIGPLYSTVDGCLDGCQDMIVLSCHIAGVGPSRRTKTFW